MIDLALFFLTLITLAILVLYASVSIWGFSQFCVWVCWWGLCWLSRLLSIVCRFSWYSANLWIWKLLLPWIIFCSFLLQCDFCWSTLLLTCCYSCFPGTLRCINPLFRNFTPFKKEEIHDCELPSLYYFPIPHRYCYVILLPVYLILEMLNFLLISFVIYWLFKKSIFSLHVCIASLVFLAVYF